MKVGVLEESVQVYTAKAAVDSQVYWVGKDELLYVLEGWPTVRNELAMMAKDRLDQVATYRYGVLISIAVPRNR